MPIIANSKTRSQEPSEMVTSPREGVINRLRKFARSQKGQAVVTRAVRDESPLTSVL